MSFPGNHSVFHFSEISGEVCNLLYERAQNKAKINTLIDQLNALDYKSGLFVALHDATKLVTAICLNVKPCDTTLAAKSAHLLNNVLARQSLQLSQDSLYKVVAWDVECVQSGSRVVLPDILHNLQTALYHSPQAGHKFAEELLGKHGILLSLITEPEKWSDKLSGSVDSQLEIVSVALRCLVTLTAQQEYKNKDNEEKLASDILQSITDAAIKFLFKGFKKGYDEFKYDKTVVYSLRVLSQVYLEHPAEVAIPLPEAVGLSKHFILYGLVVTAAAAPQKIAPSQQTVAQPLVQNARGGKKQKVRKPRNSAVEGLKKEIPVSDRSLTSGMNNFEGDGYKPASHSYADSSHCTGSVWPMTITSDSDVSDAESGRDAKLIALKTRIRQSASNLLLVLIKVTEKKEMFGYWWALLPDSPDAHAWAEEERHKRTLAYCAVHDPLAAGRAGALSVVLALLSGSRLYLSQAELCKREITSFTPFSVRVGHTISCLHRVLCGVLAAERAPTVVLLALKCCAALVQATPYHRMQAGLVADLVRLSRGFLVHRDVSIQVAALIVTGCVLSVDPAVDEILEAVRKDTASVPGPRQQNKPPAVPRSEECEDFEEGYSDDEDIFAAEPEPLDEQKGEVQSFSSWVLDICFKNLGWIFRGGKVTLCKQSAVPIMLESLQVVSAIAFHHYSSLLQPHTRLLADVFAALLGSHHAEIVLQTTRTISSVADAMQKLEVEGAAAAALADGSYFWERLLSGPLPGVLQAASAAAAPARALACDCVANVGENVFSHLPRRLQVLCVALLSGSCGDEEAAVRAAAVRALAMCALYRPLREDPCFVSDCGESILRSVREPSPVVRVKATWSLGNLSDALVINMKDPDIDDIDDDLLVRLLETAIHCSTENDKIKMNATRAMGNLLRLVTEEQLQRNAPLKPLAERGLERLLDCACRGSNMKIRWNACYALGNAMNNPVLYSALSGWQKPVLSGLCELVQECKNLKVRITAAAALRSPAARAHYAEQLPAVWRAVMAAMEAAAHLHDLTEYKHKDNLVEQLCVTLAHLCCCLSSGDLVGIADALSFHCECARTLLAQVARRLPPQHDSCARILDAAKHVTVALHSDTDTQRQALTMLQEIFIVDV